MQRRTFNNDGLALSYLDQGGSGQPIVALHAYWMEAGTWKELAEVLAPAWRVIALDQRGHGQSAHTKALSWDDFISWCLKMRYMVRASGHRQRLTLTY